MLWLSCPCLHFCSNWGDIQLPFIVVWRARAVINCSPCFWVGGVTSNQWLIRVFRDLLPCIYLLAPASYGRTFAQSQVTSCFVLLAPLFEYMTNLVLTAIKEHVNKSANTRVHLFGPSRSWPSGVRRSVSVSGSAT